MFKKFSTDFMGPLARQSNTRSMDGDETPQDQQRTLEMMVISRGVMIKFIGYIFILRVANHKFRLDWNRPSEKLLHGETR